MAQSLGFSLREIAALNVEYEQKRLTHSRGAEILRAQLVRLQEKAAHISGMISYIHAKLAWVDSGAKGPEPNFTDYEHGMPGVKLDLHRPKQAKATKSTAKRRSRRARVA
jgi:hypothetical protein